jgi:DNA-binding winged helix-turn-helix (wHTH) protein
VHEHFISAGYIITPSTEEITYQDKITQVRPKTFQLLMLLLEYQGEIVSKETMLKTVWADVIVDEQVIFQSINELRKIFNQTPIIKTYPRKGYSWISPVEKKVTVKTSAIKKPLIGRMVEFRRIKVAIILSVALILLSFTYFTIQSNVSEQQPITAPTNNHVKESEFAPGSIIILPIKSEQQDSDHQWVRYGGMDQLIHQLSSDDRFAVLQTDDILEIMKRADITSSHVGTDDISQIFRVSGASLIVESRLLGVQGEYQIVYTLHDRKDIEKGVLFDGTIDSAIGQLSQIVANKLGVASDITPDEYRSSFSNKMVATALELIKSGDHTSAAKFLETAVITEPENITAKRLLAQNYIDNYLQEKKQLEAQRILSQAIEQAELQGNSRELARLNFWLVLAQLHTGKGASYLERLNTAQKYAEEVNDWLYLGYISELKGKIYQHLKDYPLAEQQFNESINYQKVLRCPYGEVQGLLNLAELALLQNDIDKALKNNAHALEIIKKRKLSLIKDLAILQAKEIKQTSIAL